MNSEATSPSSTQAGKTIFFIEDDPLIVDIYRKQFLKEGFQVEVAGDGLAGMKLLTAKKPDVVILDLMMPKLGGADVLKFIREQSSLKSVPVIILSNSYMTDAVHQAAVAGADRALLKSRCTPRLLVNAIREVFTGTQSEVDRSVLLAVPEIYAAATASPQPTAPNPVSQPTPPPAVTPKKQEAPQADAKLLQDFLKNAPAAVASIQQLWESFLSCHDSKAQPIRLEDLRRKMHFFTSLASLAGYHFIAQVSSALEALLLELQERPQNALSSTKDTISRAIALFNDLVENASSLELEPSQSSVIVIDDDVISNRLMLSALHRAGFRAVSAISPLNALEVLQDNKFDLILLDVNMPLMDGFEFCARLRALARYKHTPIIFVTCRSDAESREQAIRGGGDDFISKPIQPVELAVKALTHLWQKRLQKN